MGSICNVNHFKYSSYFSRLEFEGGVWWWWEDGERGNMAYKFSALFSHRYYVSNWATGPWNETILWNQWWWFLLSSSSIFSTWYPKDVRGMDPNCACFPVIINGKILDGLMQFLTRALDFCLGLGPAVLLDGSFYK